MGSSATILEPIDLQQRQTVIVSDILRDVPGVAVSRTGPVGQFTQVRMRGAEANHTLVLIDGIKASDPFYGEFEFETLIADDVADTGATLKLVKDFCAEHVADVRCAVLYEKPRSIVKCEYVWRRTDRWITFPWSAEEPILQALRPGAVRRLDSLDVG